MRGQQKEDEVTWGYTQVAQMEKVGKIVKRWHAWRGNT